MDATDPVSPRGTAAPLVRTMRSLVGLLLRMLSRADLDEPAAVLEAAARAAQHRPARGGRSSTKGDLVAQQQLPAALDLADAGPAGQLAPASRALAAAAHWTQTASYVEAPPHPGFLDGYPHAGLLGPAAEGALLETPGDRLMLGLLLHAPGLDYPHHLHPADEVYVPLTAADWSSGAADPYRCRPAGVPIHHAPRQPHAMRTPTSRSWRSTSGPATSGRRRP